MVSNVTENRTENDPIEAIGLLEEPNRRRLYDLVVARGEAVGRDDAAAALGMSRELVAFHMDRLVEAGLLRTEFQRRSGRTGPGAGRPAKLYRRADRSLEVSLPPRHYEQAAEIMASALDRLGDRAGIETAMSVARERGAGAGTAARHGVGPRPGRRRLQAALVETLRGSGYEPVVEPSTGTVRLRNCPFDSLAQEHLDLTCGMNLAWAEGVADTLGGSGLHPERVPRLGSCCVEFRTDEAPAVD